MGEGVAVLATNGSAHFPRQAEITGRHQEFGVLTLPARVPSPQAGATVRRRHSPLTTYWKPPAKILILRRLSTIPSVYFPPQQLVALETFPDGIAPLSWGNPCHDWLSHYFCGQTSIDRTTAMGWIARPKVPTQSLFCLTQQLACLRRLRN
jgi:hypothetical protein